MSALGIVAVARWVWTTTTVVGAVLAVALLVILSIDVLVAAIGPGERRLAQTRGDSRRRTQRVVLSLGACFVVVVAVRFVVIYLQHRGP